MEIDFLEELPTLVRSGSVSKPNPVVVEFLELVKANAGKWAKWPLERKTKPPVPAGYEAASREGVFYVSYVGFAEEAAAEDEAVDIEELEAL